MMVMFVGVYVDGMPLLCYFLYWYGVNFVYVLLCILSIAISRLKMN